MEQYRFYSLVNFYLSSIQQGIQSGHALGEIVNKNIEQPNETEKTIIKSFLKNDKTWVVLNGGAHDDIVNFYGFLETNKNYFKYRVPFAPFYEDNKSLGGIMTCVGLIVPEQYFNCVKDPITDSYFKIISDDPEEFPFPKESIDWQLLEYIKRCPLAK